MHPATKMTPAGIAQMIDRLDKGMSYRQAAACHSIDPARAHRLHQRVKAKGMVGLEQPRPIPNTTPSAISPRRRRRAIALCADDVPVKDIARALNCHPATVYRILKTAQLKKVA